jgi:hypothetical protein
MTSGLRLTRDFDVGLARSSKPSHDAKLGKAPDPNVCCALFSGSSVCVVTGSDLRDARPFAGRAFARCRGIDSLSPLASTIGIPIEDASKPAVSDATFLDE